MCCFALVIALAPRPHLPGLYVALLDMYDVITQGGDSALMIAASECRTKVVSLLVKAGAMLGQQQKKVSINL